MYWLFRTTFVELYSSVRNVLIVGSLVLMALVLTGCYSVPPKHTAGSNKYTVALYYDKHGELLHREHLKGVDVDRDRNVGPIARHVPALKDFNSKEEPCDDGEVVKVDRTASFAIYYREIHRAGESHPVSEPIKQENFATLKRHIKCHARVTDDTCPPGYHCVSTCAGAATGNCANYCCVRNN